MPPKKKQSPPKKPRVSPRSAKPVSSESEDDADGPPSTPSPGKRSMKVVRGALAKKTKTASKVAPSRASTPDTPSSRIFVDTSKTPPTPGRSAKRTEADEISSDDEPLSPTPRPSKKLSFETKTGSSGRVPDIYHPVSPKKDNVLKPGLQEKNETIKALYRGLSPTKSVPAMGFPDYFEASSFLGLTGDYYVNQDIYLQFLKFHRSSASSGDNARNFSMCRVEDLASAEPLNKTVLVGGSSANFPKSALGSTLIVVKSSHLREPAKLDSWSDKEYKGLTGWPIEQPWLRLHAVLAAVLKISTIGNTYEGGAVAFRTLPNGAPAADFGRSRSIPAFTSPLVSPGKSKQAPAASKSGNLLLCSDTIPVYDAVKVPNSDFVVKSIVHDLPNSHLPLMEGELTPGCLVAVQYTASKFKGVSDAFLSFSIRSCVLLGFDVNHPPGLHGLDWMSDDVPFAQSSVDKRSGRSSANTVAEKDKPTEADLAFIDDSAEGGCDECEGNGCDACQEDSACDVDEDANDAVSGED